MRYRHHCGTALHEVERAFGVGLELTAHRQHAVFLSTPAEGYEIEQHSGRPPNLFVFEDRFSQRVLVLITLGCELQAAYDDNMTSARELA